LREVCHAGGGCSWFFFFLGLDVDVEYQRAIANGLMV